jgi:hypothetical protein
MGLVESLDGLLRADPRVSELRRFVDETVRRAADLCVDKAVAHVDHPDRPGTYELTVSVAKI